MSVLPSFINREIEDWLRRIYISTKLITLILANSYSRQFAEFAVLFRAAKVRTFWVMNNQNIQNRQKHFFAERKSRNCSICNRQGREESKCGGNFPLHVSLVSQVSLYPKIRYARYVEKESPICGFKKANLFLKLRLLRIEIRHPAVFLNHKNRK